MTVFNRVAAFPGCIATWKEHAIRSYVIESSYFPRAITPNQLTYIRLVLAGLLWGFLFLIEPFEGRDVAAFIVFTVGAFTDLLDGALARARKMTTVRGAFWDPIADKALVVVVVAAYLWSEAALLVLAIGIAEGVSVVVRSLGLYRQYDIRSNTFGQWKMVAQVVGVYLLIMGFLMTGFVLLFAALLLGIVSIAMHVYARKRAP